MMTIRPFRAPSRAWKACAATGLAVLLVILGGPAEAEEDAPQIPRFVSLKTAEAFMREGPSAEHRVKWIYRRKGLPLEVLAQFDVWRRVRDSDGEIGWMHVAMLSADRTALIVGKGDAPVRESDDPESDLAAQAEPGAVGRLKACDAYMCDVAFANAEGWVDRARLWGVYDRERF